MSGAGYWVSIRRNGVRLGAGFVLIGCYVLTAHHCLGDADSEPEDVEVEFEGGEMLTGRVLRRSPQADLALVDVPKSGTGPVIPRADRASAGDAWRNPYRPSLTHALLSGTIEAVPVTYQCEGGEAVEALQLGCAQDLGDYAGYSGSPVEGGQAGEESRLFGVLIEQYPKHYPTNSGSRPASAVLFAATISEVLRRFDCFDVGHLVDLLPSSSGVCAPVVAEGKGKVPASSDVPSRLATTDAIITALDGWQKRGLIDEQYTTALKLRVIEQQLLSDGDGER